MDSSPAKRVSGILVAAGMGTRCLRPDEETPKQFVRLQGTRLYLWSLRTLAAHPRIDNVVVVTLAAMIPEVERELADFGLADKVTVVAGGATRQESVRLGLLQLQSYPVAPEYVLIHDAARPFLSAEMINRTVDLVGAYGACTVCVPASDTVKRVRDGLIVETLDRETLVLVQTPQAARFDWLIEAHERASEQELATTDDAALLEATGHRVAVVPGSPYNLKVTRAEDLAICEALAKVVSGATVCDS